MSFIPKGVLPAMITPVDKNGNVDEKALRKPYQLSDRRREGGG